jgi:hypothetical protein
MRVAVRNVLASFGPMYHEYIVTRKACHGLSEHCTGAILGVERKSSEPFRDPMRCPLYHMASTSLSNLDRGLANDVSC